MAPELGMGTFRVDQMGNPGAAYVMSHMNVAEVWALRIGVYARPDSGLSPVPMVITYETPRYDPVDCDMMRKWLIDHGHNPADFELWEHTIRPCDLQKA